MNDLLPKKEELKPIVKPLNTFYECGFNADFDTLPEQQKLQIICDIIKETIYPDESTNPKTELKELRGNGFTACEVAMNYLKALKLCKNVKHVLARKRSFDPEDSDEAFNLLIVEGNSGQIYQMNPCPYVGYKCGVVQPMLEPIFASYTEVNDKIKEYVRSIKEVLYLNRCRKMDQKLAQAYLDRCVMAALDYPILREYSNEALKVIVKYLENGIIKERVQEIIKENSKSNYLERQRKERRLLLEKQIALWQEELAELKYSKTNVKRQLELSQWIIQEGKKLHPEWERKREVDGEMMKLSSINPRVLYEKGLNTIFIKTSAYFLGCQDEIRETLLGDNPPKGEYQVNLSEPTEQTGIKPMLFSHPLGENCARSLDGRTDVLLIKEDPDTIYKKKKALRNIICGPLWGKELTWTDGKPILWDPMITNITHGTDHAPEAALHFLVGNPEHQNMTRFMYPNPKLKYKTYQKG